MMKKGVFLLILCCLILSALPAQTSVAVIGFENLNGDPRYDYIGGMLLGITLFDLASFDEIALINRADIESVLQEQKLALSGLVAGNDNVIEVGNLIGAQYLLKGEFIFLGADIMITVTLIDVNTGQAEVFRERGSGENMVHIINSKILKHLIGKNINLVGDQPDRSLVSLKDEKPGTVKVFSHLDRAEVFIDEEFTGYTTGDAHNPLLIEGVKPGKHLIRVHLYEFGVFVDHTLKFADWQKEIDVSPGQVMILKSDAAHKSEKIRRIKDIFSDKIYISKENEDRQEKSAEITFIDQNGKEIIIEFTYVMEKDGSTRAAAGTLVINGKVYEISIPETDEKYVDAKEDFDIITCNLKFFGTSFTVELSRNDINYSELIRKYY